MKGKVILQFDYNLNSYVGQYFVIIDSKTEQNNSNGRTHGKGI